MKIILSIVIFLLWGCTKKKEISTTTDFPNEVGTHWRYKLTDNSGTSFVDVDITGTKVLSNGQNAKVWIYNYLGYSYIDTALVVTNNDTVIIFKATRPALPSGNYIEKLRYQFPLQVGAYWIHTVYTNDTTKVLSASPVTVPAGYFSNSMKLSKTVGFLVNTLTRDTIWFSPNVGMVKLRQYQLDLGAVIGNGIWELAEYSSR